MKKLRLKKGAIIGAYLIAFSLTGMGAFFVSQNMQEANDTNEDIEYVSGYYGGSYAPALPLIFGYTMYPYSLEYWQNEYHNWFEVFLQAENENGDGGDSGRDEGGGEEGGGDKGDDKWKEDLKNIGISDAYGAARGAVNACIGLGTGLIVPGVNLGVGGTIALMALSIGVEESIMTALTQSKDDVRMYMIEGVYPSY